MIKNTISSVKKTKTTSAARPSKGRKAFRASFAINEFCARHGLARSSYYDLKDKGFGPTELRAGGIIRITREAEKEWIERMEAAKHPEAPKPAKIKPSAKKG